MSKINPEHEGIIREAISEAIKRTKEEPLKVGDIVAYVDDPKTYGLLSINEDGTALVGYYDKGLEKDVTRVYPLGQLFNTHTAMDIARTIKVRRIINAAPLN